MCGLYKEQALQTWANGDVADPWLITAEVSSGGLSVKNPNRNAKIPDVAKKFGVRTNNLYYMMRQLGIKI